MTAGRPLSKALRQKSLTKVSSRNHAFSANVGNVKPLALPNIMDILDAPAMLDSTSGRRFFIRLQQASNPPMVSTTAQTFSSPVISLAGLPAPLLFEGPAHPRSSNLFSSTKPPIRTVEPLPPTSSNKKTSSRNHSSTSIPLSINNAAMHTYDGPSNMTRYRYSGQKKKNDDGRKPLLALVSLATLGVGATVCLDL